MSNLVSISMRYQNSFFKNTTRYHEVTRYMYNKNIKVYIYVLKKSKAKQANKKPRNYQINMNFKKNMFCDSPVLN